ncbi:androgen-induced gene 1 protein [Tachysurus ichikawai]
MRKQVATSKSGTVSCPRSQSILRLIGEHDVNRSNEHTTVLPFIIIEMRTTHHLYPSRACGLLAVCSFCVGYILWMCWVYNVTGVWVYPLLEHIDTLARVVFFSCLTALTSLYYIMGEILNTYIWDSSRSALESNKDKSD